MAHDGEAAVIEDQLRAGHVELLSADRRLDFAEVHGHVPVRMGE